MNITFILIFGLLNILPLCLLLLCSILVIADNFFLFNWRLDFTLWDYLIDIDFGADNFKSLDRGIMLFLLLFDLLGWDLFSNDFHTCDLNTIFLAR